MPAHIACVALDFRRSLHFVAEDRQLLADGLAQYVGLAEVARDQALHLGLVDEGIRLIVQRLVDLGRGADQRGLGG